jgi:hypothetical protein
MLAAVPPADAGSAPVYLVRITGAISPGNADFLGSAIHKANAEGAGCLIVMLDTPGGLAESMRKMVMAIYESRYPSGGLCGAVGRPGGIRRRDDYHGRRCGRHGAGNPHRGRPSGQRRWQGTGMKPWPRR